MNIRSYYSDGKLKICLEGELDHHAAKKTVAQIESCIDEHLPGRLILDFSALSFMDSSGIAVILKSFRRMNELEGDICVENASKQPLRVIDAAGLDKIVKITTSAKEKYI